MAMTRRKFEHPLGLGIREWNVIRGALLSRTQYGIANYLPPLGSRRSVERLVARGFITLAEPLIPINSTEPWLVVTLTDENVASYNRAMKVLEGA
jgi:hypothetical protein